MSGVSCRRRLCVPIFKCYSVRKTIFITFIYSSIFIFNNYQILVSTSCTSTFLHAEKHVAKMKVWMFFLCLSDGWMHMVSITNAAPTPSSAPMALTVDESTQLVVKPTNYWRFCIFCCNNIEYFVLMWSTNVMKETSSVVCSACTGLVDEIWIHPTVRQIHRSAAGLDHCH